MNEQLRTVWNFSRHKKDIKGKIYTINEIKKLKPIFMKAESLWNEEQEKYYKSGKKSGSCVSGSGFCLWAILPKKRKAQLVYVVDPRNAGHWHGELMWEDSKDKIEEFLINQGVENVQYIMGNLC